MTERVLGPGPDFRLAVVMPALNEEESVGEVVRRCRSALAGMGRLRVMVGDNGSRDRTAAVASAAGAEVVSAPVRGYGSACLSALSALGDWPEVVIFLDADGSSAPEEAKRLLGPLFQGDADLVLGRRPESAAMTPPQRWGTRLAVALVNAGWGSCYQDMGPFRAITGLGLRRLGMSDRTWGWTIEMQILACEHRLRVLEVPVSWHARLGGKSKISGTVSGVAKAGGKILWTVARYWLRSRSGR